MPQIVSLWNSDGTRHVTALNVPTLRKIGMTVDEAESFLRLWNNRATPLNSLVAIETFFNNSFPRFEFEFTSQMNGNYEFIFHLRDDHQLNLWED